MGEKHREMMWIKDKRVNWCLPVPDCVTERIRRQRKERKEAYHKPEMDVTVLPRRATWYAMDSFGIWYWYKERPDRNDYEWISFAPYGKICEEYAPKWTGRWQDSLTEIKS